MSLLQIAPQDGPASSQIRNFLIANYFLITWWSVLQFYPFGKAILLSILDIALLYLFTFALLKINDKSARFAQTFNALLGIGFLVSLLAAITVFLNRSFGLDTESTQQPGIASILLLFWIVAGYGHVVRHSIEVKLASGLLIAFGYLLFSSILIQAI